MEDNTVKGGFGSSVAEVIAASDINAKIKMIGFPDEFVRHGSKSRLMQYYGIDNDTIAKDILIFINRK
jgi:1-deoxy-D-xylulose-5-phosphate synthase